MAKVCAISGRKQQAGRNTRHVHSGQWAHRAPKTCRVFGVNLQTVSVPIPGGGTKKIKVAARMLTSRKFKAILAGQAPLPKGV
ncbi:L28 family ribosomal protein [Armatimonas sp.]|uniref:large ribosomal subunit protein bL28 n=1 Tax=Armatimonas sp. TaxID=1872638 RepID=UPI00286CD4E6|nr:L28 family ribosomal protein [Armatimonas sp.]